MSPITTALLACLLVLGQGRLSANETAQSADAPLLSMEQAVAKARAYAAKKHIKIGKAYLQAAIFHPVARDAEINGRSWEIIWQLPRARGGTTTICVFESGEFRVSFGE